MPTSQRGPKPVGSREIGEATGVAAGVTVAVSGRGRGAGGGDTEAGGLVGDGVMSDSAEASTVSVASLPAESLVEVVLLDGVDERVTVALFIVAAVLVGELISVAAGVLVGRLAAVGVRVGVAAGVEVGVEAGVLVGLGGAVAVGEGE